MGKENGKRTKEEIKKKKHVSRKIRKTGYKRRIKTRMNAGRKRRTAKENGTGLRVDGRARREEEKKRERTVNK